MAKRAVDPNRIKDDDDRLKEASEAAKYLADQRGVRGAAALLEWNMADISRISNAKWREIRMYPETVEAVLMAARLVENDEALIAPLRDELREFSREVGVVARRSARICGMIKRVTR